MKKLKTLGLISLALISGGTLITLPLAITSCGKSSDNSPTPPIPTLLAIDGPSTIYGTVHSLINNVTLKCKLANTIDTNARFKISENALPSGLLFKDNLNGTAEIYGSPNVTGDSALSQQVKIEAFDNTINTTPAYITIG
jgi:hypothetical protein